MAETRKTVLFIVEGPSDKEALEKIFKKIYKNERSIEFKFTNGDISSDPAITNDNDQQSRRAMQKNLFTRIQASLIKILKKLKTGMKEKPVF